MISKFIKFQIIWIISKFIKGANASREVLLGHGIVMDAIKGH